MSSRVYVVIELWENEILIASNNKDNLIKYIEECKSKIIDSSYLEIWENEKQITPLGDRIWGKDKILEILKEEEKV